MLTFHLMYEDACMVVAFVIMNRMYSLLCSIPSSMKSGHMMYLSSSIGLLLLLVLS